MNDDNDNDNDSDSDNDSDNDAVIADILQRTLANAVRAPYYARVFGDRWRGVRTFADLQALPLLDKRTAIAHQHELVAETPPAGFGVASSGTTRADVDLPPLNVLTTADEVAGADSAAALAAPAGPAADVIAVDGAVVDDEHPGWTLVCVSVNHGLPIGAPRDGEIFVPWMVDRNALYMMETVLSQQQPDGRRVTAMRLSGGAIKVLTAWMLERGKDPGELFGVRLIGTNSFRLSAPWRALVEKTFRAEVFDNFSLSEFATPATECKACGWLHFGWPPVVFEVLDVVTGKSLEEGVGRLVMTGVYPWSRIMPLIRYDTGDVAEIGPVCAAAGAPRIRVLGRLRRGVVVDDGGAGRYVLAPRFVVDVLEARPDTERDLHPFTKMGFIHSRDIGLPRFTSTKDGDDVTLRFEVRFDPHLFREHARVAEDEVRAALLTLDGPLQRLVEAGRVRFVVVACRPQSLTPVPDKYD